MGFVAVFETGKPPVDENTEGLLCDFVSFALGLLVFPNIGNDVCKYIYIVEDLAESLQLLD